MSYVDMKIVTIVVAVAWDITSWRLYIIAKQ